MQSINPKSRPAATQEDVSNDDALPNALPLQEHLVEEDASATPNDPFEHSDEALPSDDEERAIDQDPSRESGRFGEIVEVENDE